MVTAGYFLGKIGMKYLNSRLLKFEPFLDPWEFEAAYLQIKE
jgi:hypothetical protein